MLFHIHVVPLNLISTFLLPKPDRDIHWFCFFKYIKRVSSVLFSHFKCIITINAILCYAISRVSMCKFSPFLSIVLYVVGFTDSDYLFGIIICSTCCKLSLSFHISLLVTSFGIRLKRRVSPVEQELLTLLEHMSLPPLITCPSGVGVVQCCQIACS